MADKYMYLDKRVIRTKKQLKEALILLLEQMDFNEVTIKNLIDVAKISRGTFYNNYHSKEELLIELVEDVVFRLVRICQEPYKAYIRFVISDILPSTVKIFDHIYEHATLYRTIVNSNILPIFRDYLIEGLNQVILQDIIVLNPKINQEFFAGYQANAIGGMIIGWVRDDFKNSPSYMAEQLMETVKLPGNQLMERTKLRKMNL
jgi:AcrR family transcriptional regulator